MVNSSRDAAGEASGEASHPPESGPLVGVGALAEATFHDLGGPLTYLLANLEYLDCQLARHEADLAPGRVAELRQCLQEATSGAARIRDIVRDAVASGRADRGHSDLRRVLLTCIKVARTEIDHRARVITEFDAVPQVAGTEARLSRLFLNLIVNAAQAVAGDPENEHFIRVVTRADADRRVTVDIADSGPGIAPEHLERIFEPYFTTKPAGSGTGLGLAICKHIVDDLGGSLTVESTPGRGATFRVTLPAASTRPTDPAQKEGAPRFSPSTPPVRRLPLRQLG
ncbi:MAG TPA: HAMP domain-containing sensor histidine kinase [Polyangiaceae bacterium]|nr:HAMP domain-containing sensor histidine kinase [Polyangiaceae bacterium]